MSTERRATQDTERQATQDTEPANAEGLAAAAALSYEDVVALYDDWVDADYDGDVGSWSYDVPTRLAARLAADIANRNRPVLDAACGTGLGGLALRNEGFSAIDGVDASAPSLDRARNRGVYRHLELVDLNGPVPSPADGYAGIVCSGALTYMSDVEATLRHLLAALSAGGRLHASHRTDLWAAQDCPTLLARIESDTGAAIDYSEPEPYLPGHPEYADEVKVIIISMTAP